jgi:hypothetical protein
VRKGPIGVIIGGLAGLTAATRSEAAVHGTGVSELAQVNGAVCKEVFALIVPIACLRPVSKGFSREPTIPRPLVRLIVLGIISLGAAHITAHVALVDFALPNLPMIFATSGVDR